jgi:hypothetical protein
MSGSTTVTAGQPRFEAPFQFDGDQRSSCRGEHANVDARRFFNTSQQYVQSTHAIIFVWRASELSSARRSIVSSSDNGWRAFASGVAVSTDIVRITFHVPQLTSVSTYGERCICLEKRWQRRSAIPAVPGVRSNSRTAPRNPWRALRQPLQGIGDDFGASGIDRRNPACC